MCMISRRASHFELQLRDRQEARRGKCGVGCGYCSSFPLGCSPAGVVLGPEASPTRAGAAEGECGVDRTRALTQRSSMAGPTVTASDKAKNILADFFNAADLPADALSRHHRGKRGARVEQRREDRTHVSKHQSREEDGRGVSGLLPPSRWHLGKNQAGRREAKRGKYSVLEQRRVEGRKSDARKKRRHRRIRRAAQKLRADARARSRPRM